MYPDEPEETNDGKPAPPPKAKPSLVPSWIMLGFVVGALFVLALPRSRPAPPRLEQSESTPVTIIKTPPQITMIEAVFAEWGKYAVWDNDITEVALWSSETHAFSDCFEVLRSGGTYFFRSIPRLTRPVLTHGTREHSPLQFTETEAQRAEWLGEKRQETWKALSAAARENLQPRAAASQKASEHP
jgi:hypothetical protein